MGYPLFFSNWFGEVKKMEHSLEKVKKIVDPTKKVKVSLKVQLVILFDLIIWLLVLLRLGASATQRGFLDWVSSVFFWALIIVAALLALELLLLTIFYKQLMEAPLVLFGVFAMIVAIDVIIVIVILGGMGFISGVPIGV